MDIPLIGGDGLGITAAHAANSPVINPINGKIFMISIDASSMATEAEVLKQYIAQGKQSGEVNPEVVFENCAIASRDINDWTDPDRKQYADCWNQTQSKITQAGFTMNDVQVIWCKLEDLVDNGNDDGRVVRLFWKFVTLAQLFKIKFPNCKKLYLSGRSHMPTTDVKFKEPLAYLNGLAVKMVVQEQIAGNPELDWRNGIVPWISDIIYLWTDGFNTRADGYSRTADSYKNDGVHPNPIGDEQVATLVYNTLLDYSNFFENAVRGEESGPFSDTAPYEPLPEEDYVQMDSDYSSNEPRTGSLGSALVVLAIGYGLFNIFNRNKHE